MKTSQKILLIVFALVLLVGVGAGIDLTYIHFKVTTDTSGEYQSFCNINESLNCDAVAQTRWAKFFGVPISLLGTLTYLFCLALLVLRWRKPPSQPPHAAVYLVWIAIFSVLYTAFLAWICYAEIGSWCIMCMVLYAVNALMLGLALATSNVPFGKHAEAIKADLAWVLGDKRLTAALVVVMLGAVAMFAGGMIYEKRLETKRIAAIMSKFQTLDELVSAVGDVYGNPDGKVVAILFSDYQCPFCMRMEVMLHELSKKYKELKIVRRDFPLDQACNPIVQQPFHAHACEATMFKTCAAEQGKLLAVHNALLANQREIGPKLFAQMISEFSLDRNKLADCMNGGNARYKLRQDLSAGIGIGLTGTPTLVLDGNKMLVGGVSMAELERIIQVESGE